MAGLLTKSARGQALAPAVRRRPLGFREEMEDLLSRLWGEDAEGWITGRLAPSIDLSETDTALEARVDLPGIKPSDIDVQVSGNLLTVSGQREEEKEEKGRTFHHVERRSGSFSRSISLPCNVQESEVAAQYHDGVLTITLPKTEEAKAHKIKVKT